MHVPKSGTNEFWHSILKTMLLSEAWPEEFQLCIIRKHINHNSWNIYDNSHTPNNLLAAFHCFRVLCFLGRTVYPLFIWETAIHLRKLIFERLHHTTSYLLPMVYPLKRYHDCPRFQLVLVTCYNVLVLPWTLHGRVYGITIQIVPKKNDNRTFGIDNFNNNYKLM